VEERQKVPGFAFSARDNEFDVERDGTISMSKNSNRERGEKKR
jgi:hypothetical protein